ncbi:MAG: DUF1127 domain-containing protein [Gemmobacter sp.]
MLDRLRTWIGAHRVRDAIDALSDRDIADIGLSRGAMTDLATIPATIPARMTRMAALFGVSGAGVAADRPTYLEALGRCAHCSAARTCAQAFTEGSATASAVGFCPNAPLYRDLAAQAG